MKLNRGGPGRVHCAGCYRQPWSATLQRVRRRARQQQSGKAVPRRLGRHCGAVSAARRPVRTRRHERSAFCFLCFLLSPVYCAARRSRLLLGSALHGIPSRVVWSGLVWVSGRILGTTRHASGDLLSRNAASARVCGVPLRARSCAVCIASTVTALGRLFSPDLRLHGLMDSHPASTRGTANASAWLVSTPPLQEGTATGRAALESAHVCMYCMFVRRPAARPLTLLSSQNTKLAPDDLPTTAWNPPHVQGPALNEYGIPMAPGIGSDHRQGL